MTVGTKTLHGIKRVLQWSRIGRVNSIISGRSPPLHFTFTLITMQGHRNRSRLVFKEKSELVIIQYQVVFLEKEFQTKVQ